jgi:hypothetical protein
MKIIRILKTQQKPRDLRPWKNKTINKVIYKYCQQNISI